MKKYFVVADVHGHYDELMKGLNSAEFDPSNPDHIFVSLGDLIDRGHQPRECIEFVNSLDPSRRILIRGNHEDMMEIAITKMAFDKYSKHNGTIQTVIDMTGKDGVDGLIAMRNDPAYNAYIRECQNYYETNECIFVHGWIPHFAYPKGFDENHYSREYWENWRNASNDEWFAARWDNGMECWGQGVRVPGKTIFCGHFHTSWGHAYIHHDHKEFPQNLEDHDMLVYWFRPFMDEGIVAMDSCTVISHVVHCAVVEDEPLEESK